MLAPVSQEVEMMGGAVAIVEAVTVAPGGRFSSCNRVKYFEHPLSCQGKGLNG